MDGFMEDKTKIVDKTDNEEIVMPTNHLVLNDNLETLNQFLDQFNIHTSRSIENRNPELQNFSRDNNDATRVPSSGIVYFARDVLGHGGSSIVYKGYVRDERQPAAIKCVNMDHFKVYENELKIWLKIKSEDSKNTVNIVKLMDYVQDKTTYVFAMEIAETTLGKRVKNEISYEQTVSFIKDAANGLDWLHHQKPPIIHRDVKPDNILIFKHAGGIETAKLADFGISRQISQENVSGTNTSYNGTYYWMAPEAISAKHENKELRNKTSLDIFSLGTTAYFALSKGEHPFRYSEQFKSDVVSNIKSGQISPVPFLDANLVTAPNLCYWMMQKNPGMRPNIREVLLHPYFWDLKKSLCFFVDLANANDDRKNKTWNVFWDVADGTYRKYLEKSKKVKLNWIPSEALPYLSPKARKPQPKGAANRTLNEEALIFQDSSTVDALFFKRADGVKSYYDGNSLKSLVRFIRDKSQHSESMNDQLKEHLFGKSEMIIRFDPQIFISYFLQKYPDMLNFLFCSLANQRERQFMDGLCHTYFSEMRPGIKCHWGDNNVEVDRICVSRSRLCKLL